ncbi:hypothetical protein Btru_073535 [Bulinus truncatus]|nr:hypothetical protein Btru_073535 [Bulinus truncatus]
MCCPTSLAGDQMCCPTSLAGDQMCCPTCLAGDQMCCPTSLAGDQMCCPTSLADGQMCCPTSLAGDQAVSSHGGDGEKRESSAEYKGVLDSDEIYGEYCQNCTVDVFDVEIMLGWLRYYQGHVIINTFFYVFNGYSQEMLREQPETAVEDYKGDTQMGDEPPDLDLKMAPV